MKLNIFHQRKLPKKKIKINCFCFVLFVCLFFPSFYFSSFFFFFYIKHTHTHTYQSCNPIYTIKTDSLFILDISTQELQNENGILLKVKDYDSLGRNDDLCSVQIPDDVLLKANGERIEFDLQNKRGNNAGKIAIRCKPTTNYDRQFLSYIYASMDDNSTKQHTRRDVDSSSENGNATNNNIMEEFSAGIEKAMKSKGGENRLRDLFKYKTIEKEGKYKIYFTYK